MEKTREQPPKPEDFKNEDGSINWIAYFEAWEEYEISKYGMR